MSYSVFRVQGIKKTTDLNGLHKHIKQRISRTNIDIDLDKSKDNIELISCNDTYKQRFNEITKDLKLVHDERMKTMRADRIKSFERYVNDSKNNVACEMIFTSDTVFFKDMNKNEIEKWAKTSLDFVTEDIGMNKENIIHAVVHMDEKTPHLHVVVVPITKIYDGRIKQEKLTISQNKFFHGKKDLSKLQDKYNHRMVSNGFKLARGEKNINKRHKTTMEYKNEIQRQTEVLKKDKQKIEKEVVELKSEKEQRTKEFSTTTKILHENSLVMYQINEIETENVFFSSEKVKIKKSDFEKLKESALKAYMQHNLYANVESELERLKKRNRYLEKENDIQYNKLNNMTRDHSYKLHYLKQEYEQKLNQEKQKNINLHKQLKIYDEVIDKHNLFNEVDKAYEKYNKKEDDKSKNYNKSYNL
ncbi:MobV family relaxase [Clostridium tarantellae]|uniref:MobV family relaxase n=1 Tax=Clostridium tarantellae TaxID=39493 RepID=UPI0014793B3F|nr:MobV family relaxase [Clostridium tarantellae]